MVNGGQTREKTTTQGKELERGVNSLVKGPNSSKYCYFGVQVPDM